MTTTLDPTTLTARQAAIQASGAARDFKLVQFRNPVFWVFMWALITGLVRLVGFYQPSLGNYGGALAGGTAAFGLYTVVWIVFLHHLDRFTPLPPKLLATGFLWGAVVATTFLALTVNTAVLTLYTKLFGTAWASDWAAGFTAPFTEETAKAIGFVMILGLAPLLIRSVFDGFIAGAFIGLGFEVSEDVLYVYQGAAKHFGTDQTAASIQMIALRAASGVVSHAMFTGLVCAGLMWLLGRDPRGRNIVKGVGFILFAATMHFAWDNAGAIGSKLLGPAAGLLMFLLIAVGVIAVVWVGKDSAVTERRWAHDVLAPEVTDDVITEPELAALSGTHRDRRRYVKSIHGHHARKTTKHVLAAAQELGVALARSNGDDSPTVEHARSEVLRVRQD